MKLFPWKWRAEVFVVPVARCSSDLGQYQRHLYEGAPVCIRCGVDNPKYVEPAEPDGDKPYTTIAIAATDTTGVLDEYHWKQA